ncbi:MAG: hydrogenase formation protein HypD [Chloroflexi bacterium RBG_16_64_43]|nr:MAG: hydrogenase formation protein HypD [Chloroflexi bacterium RBG_16_64_43]
MKYIDEYRDRESVQRLLGALRSNVTRPWTLMEICGGQTHAFLRFGLDALLPSDIELVHGPGCPVCVTPVEQIDRAVAIAGREGVIFTSFGDMLRVPGTRSDLFAVRARGGDVRVVYSPLDAVKLAQDHPERQVVFFAIGFETTAPANAMAAIAARARGLSNFSMLVSQVCVPPAMEAILASPRNRVQAFLAAGHVCAVMGYWQYHPIAARFHVPIAVTGFEPVDLMRGMHAVVTQLEAGQAKVDNAYGRVVSEAGNRPAQEAMAKVFEACDRQWRGIGMIPLSGLRLRPQFADLDAEARFDVGHVEANESSLCIAGEVLMGHKKPTDCPAFGRECTPTSPLGAPMVSAEGTCAAYFRYARPQE